MKFSELKSNTTLYHIYFNQVVPVELKSVTNSGTIVNYGMGFAPANKDIKTRDLYETRREAETVLRRRLSLQKRKSNTKLNEFLLNSSLSRRSLSRI